MIIIIFLASKTVNISKVRRINILNAPRRGTSSFFVYFFSFHLCGHPSAVVYVSVCVSVCVYDAKVKIQVFNWIFVSAILGDYIHFLIASTRLASISLLLYDIFLKVECHTSIFVFLLLFSGFFVFICHNSFKLKCCKLKTFVKNTYFPPVKVTSTSELYCRFTRLRTIIIICAGKTLDTDVCRCC